MAAPPLVLVSHSGIDAQVPRVTPTGRGCSTCSPPLAQGRPGRRRPAPGALFRQGAEAKIRTHILKSDVVDAVIGLGCGPNGNRDGRQSPPKSTHHALRRARRNGKRGH